MQTIEKLNKLLRKRWRKVPPFMPLEFYKMHWAHYNQKWSGGIHALVEKVNDRNVLKKLQWAEQHFVDEQCQKNVGVGLVELMPNNYNIWVIARDETDLDRYKMCKIFNDMQLQ